MKNQYKNETCEGCIHYLDDICDNIENWVDYPNVSGEPLKPIIGEDSAICFRFRPSLECRKVRALERLVEELPDHVHRLCMDLLYV